MYTGHIILLLILFFLIAFANITIHIGLTRSPSTQKLNMTIYILKIIKIYEKVYDKKDKKKDTPEQFREKILNQIERSTEILVNSFNIIHSYNLLIKKTNKLLLKGVKSEKLEVTTRVGTEDAAITAILCGLFWSFLGIIKLSPENAKILTDLDFKIQPEYQKNFFAVEINCIFRFKTVNIIYVYNTIKQIFMLEKESGGKNI